MQLIIANVGIRQDAKNRFCLNDLHRAAGGEDRHSPNRFTRSETYRSLVAELTPDLAFAPSASVRGGLNPGTYVCRELVYCYAMWISPKFHLKVIRAYDAMVTAPALPEPPELQLARAIITAGQMIEKQNKLITQQTIMIEDRDEFIAEIEPKAHALDRLSHAHGALCLRDAAKVLQVSPVKLNEYLQKAHWVFRRGTHRRLIAYQDKITSGLLVHKITPTPQPSDPDHISAQVLVTTKGLTKLATLMGVKMIAVQGSLFEERFAA